MKNSLRLILNSALILSLIAGIKPMVNAQIRTRNYPTEIFKFPINPGSSNYLSGTMGELRGNHYHSGIDVKTYGKTGLPIYSIADGYVSRIKVSPYGYGLAIYVTHPSIGYVSVYAHCKSYASKINQYVLDKQYEKKSFSIDVHPGPEDFKVKKGEIIAYSGNTGGSFGPHLHFEIRDSYGNVLNPLFFKFKEVKDNIKPLILRVKLVPLTKDTRINGKYESYITDVKRISAGKFQLPSNVKATGVIGVQVKTYDQFNGASNKNGVSAIDMKVNGSDAYNCFVESFSFEETRYINRHVDYDDHYFNKEWYQKCYLDDGNKLRFYKFNNSKGKISIGKDETKSVEIKVYDAHMNISELTFKIEGKDAQPSSGFGEENPMVFDMNKGYIKKKQLTKRKGKRTMCYRVNDNTLIATSIYPLKKPETASFYLKGRAKEVKACISNSNQCQYLWDLRRGLPDSVKIGDKAMPFYFVSTVPGEKKVSIYNPVMDITFSKKALYDTLYLEIEKTENDYRIGEMGIPLQRYVHVSLKLGANAVTKKSKTHAYSYDKDGHLVYEGGYWSGNVLKFKTRSLGTYTYRTDTKKPRITRLPDNGNSLQFKLADDLSGIDSYTAYINGKWVLLEYNYKKHIVNTRQRNLKKALKGKFKLVIKDNAGNTQTYETTL